MQDATLVSAEETQTSSELQPDTSLVDPLATVKDSKEICQPLFNILAWNGRKPISRQSYEPVPIDAHDQLGQIEGQGESTQTRMVLLENNDDPALNQEVIPKDAWYR